MHASAEPILVIDAGTSALRAVLVDPTGEVELIGKEAWRSFAPDDASPYAREYDPGRVTSALSRLLAEAAQRGRYAGIAITGQREGVAFLDDAGQPILLSPNVDGRAAMDGIAIDAAHGERVYAVTGHLPSLLQAPAKLLWLRRNRPDDAARVARIMPIADWLAMTLTGEAGMSRTLASEIGVVDVATGDVATDLLKLLDFSPSFLPQLYVEGAILGAVLEGPLSGAPVVLAGADTQCALLGMGALDEGAAAAVAGWSIPVQFIPGSPIVDDSRRLWAGLHGVCGRWLLESNAGDIGRSWEWICSLFALSPQAADNLAATAQPCARDALAIFGRPTMHAAHMTMGTGGVVVPLPLAMPAPERRDLLRAALEGAAFAVRANLEQIESVAEAVATSFAIGGGMSQSALFNGIVAHVLGRPVAIARTPQTAALGAAAVAAPALGLYATVREAVAHIGHPMTVIEPDLHLAGMYEDAYERWRSVAERLNRA